MTNSAVVSVEKFSSATVMTTAKSKGRGPIVLVGRAVGISVRRGFRQRVANKFRRHNEYEGSNVESVCV